MGAAVGEPQGSVAEVSRSNGVDGKILETKLPVVDLKSVTQKKEWNTKNIGQRLGVDIACAATAGGLVAPVICMIDKYAWQALGTQKTAADKDLSEPSSRMRLGSAQWDSRFRHPLAPCCSSRTGS